MLMANYFKGLTGTVVTPLSPQYDEARQEWNRAIQKFPAVIVYCHNEKDVQNAVLWARQRDICLRIRSGGHHYEGYSTGNQVLVIDLSEMSTIQLNEQAKCVTVQGGVNNSQMYRFLGSRGYPFPGGNCPTVGLSGFTLGGGWGYGCRYLGLGCDNLLELRLVNYKGEILTANIHEHADLFWACRGAGGGNFGIVVSMTFRLPQKIDQVTLIEMSYPNAPSAAQAGFLDTWQKWLVGLDIRMGMQASIYNSIEEGMAIFGRGLFYGSPQEAAVLLLPFSQTPGLTVTLQYLPFLEAIAIIEESYPESEKFKSTGRFVFKQYSPRELSQIVDLIKERPVGSAFVSVSLYALGGAVSQVPWQNTAYFYRQAAYIMLIQSVWTDNQYARANRAWVEERFQYLKTITKGSYVNFPYSPLSNYERAYFGKNVPRLRVIKGSYDPCNIFCFPQSICSYDA